MSLTVPPPHQTLPCLSCFEKKQLEKAVALARQDYSPAKRMLRSPFKSPGYHTTYQGPTVHQTRQSLIFAVALLDTGIPDDRHDAIDIIEKVISLQDQNPDSHTYGIWPWFLEEPIAEMSPPDWNWADFCGVHLLEARLTHASFLPSKLLSQMDDAIFHAASSIQRRNVKLDYTNIVVMGSFVTLMAGELLEKPDFVHFATDRLKRFYDYTLEQSSFSEYNSPPYTGVTLNELRRLQRFVQDPELRPLIDNLHTRAWEEIALHFHPQTGQWSGPHSRCYETLLTPQLHGLIQRALGKEDPNECLVLDQHRLAHRCPKQFLHYFDADAPTASRPRTVTSIFGKGSPEIVGTTYLHPQFSLGTINYSDLFNQRRPLVAYWGAPGNTRYLRLRFIHDGYDFTAAQFYSTQTEGELLAAIGFATDGGDRHPHFDRLVNGQFEASDLRLRFEIGGVTPEMVKTIDMDASKAHGHFNLDGIFFSIQAIEAIFGDCQGWLETSFQDNQFCIDIVFHSGPQRTFQLGQGNSRSPEKMRVAVAFAASFSTHPPKAFSKPKQGSAIDDTYTRYVWHDMQLIAPTTPAPLEAMKQASQ